MIEVQTFYALKDDINVQFLFNRSSRRKNHIIPFILRISEKVKPTAVWSSTVLSQFLSEVCCNVDD